jgi:hypothetical protein
MAGVGDPHRGGVADELGTGATACELAAVLFAQPQANDVLITCDHLGHHVGDTRPFAFGTAAEKSR